MAKNWHDYTAMTAALSSGADDVLVRDKSDLADNATEGTVRRLGWESLLAVSGITPGGRLTLESGVPVSTTDQTAKGTLYYTPYVHDYVRLYDGTRPNLYTFTERSLSLTLTSGKNYDVFLYDNSGTLTLELSAAWTNDSTRADALAWQAGVGYVKSGTATRLWLGTIRASGTNTTESSWNTTDAPTKSYLWNAYNQIMRTTLVQDSTDSYTYTTATIRQRRGSTNNQCDFVCGLATPWQAQFCCISTNNLTGTRQNFVGIDSTTTPTGCHGYGSGIAVQYFEGYAIGGGIVAAGYHFITALERSDASGTSTWGGDWGVTYLPSGLVAKVWY